MAAFRLAVGGACNRRGPVHGDHSSLAYSEVLPDERAATIAGFWDRAVA